MANTNWLEARKAYIEDPTMTYAMIAERFSVSERQVERKASEEGWRERRESVGKKSAERHEAKVTEELSKLNDEHESVLKNIYIVANKTIEAMVETKTIDGKEVTVLKAGVNPGALEKAAKAAKIGIEGVRVIKGLPIIIAKSEVNADLNDNRIPPEEARETMERLSDRGKRMEEIMAKQEPVTKPKEPVKA